MTLDQLRAGQYGRILSVGGAGPLRRRLMAMGLTPGTKVYVRKVAPLKDPIELYLRGYEFTLRGEDAAKIDVTLLSGEGENGHDVRTGRQSEQWKDHAFQPADRQQPARGQFSRGHGRKKRWRGERP